MIYPSTLCFCSLWFISENHPQIQARHSVSPCSHSACVAALSIWQMDYYFFTSTFLYLAWIAAMMMMMMMMITKSKSIFVFVNPFHHTLNKWPLLPSLVLSSISVRELNSYLNILDLIIRYKKETTEVITFVGKALVTIKFQMGAVNILKCFLYLQKA